MLVDGRNGEVKVKYVYDAWDNHKAYGVINAFQMTEIYDSITALSVRVDCDLNELLLVPY